MSTSKKPPTPAEALKLARDYARAGKIKFAMSDAADDLEEEIDSILEAIGMSEKQISRCFVSNESMISDFDSLRGEMTTDGWIEKLQSDLGVPVSVGDKVVDVARRLRGKMTS